MRKAETIRDLEPIAEPPKSIPEVLTSGETESNASFTDAELRAIPEIDESFTKGFELLDATGDVVALNGGDSTVRRTQNYFKRLARLSGGGRSARDFARVASIVAITALAVPGEAYGADGDKHIEMDNAIAYEATADFTNEEIDKVINVLVDAIGNLGADDNRFDLVFSLNAIGESDIDANEKMLLIERLIRSEDLGLTVGSSEALIYRALEAENNALMKLYFESGSLEKRQEILREIAKLFTQGMDIDAGKDVSFSMSLPLGTSSDGRVGRAEKLLIAEYTVTANVADGGIEVLIKDVTPAPLGSGLNTGGVLGLETTVIVPESHMVLK